MEERAYRDWHRAALDVCRSLMLVDVDLSKWCATIDIGGVGGNTIKIPIPQRVSWGSDLPPIADTLGWPSTLRMPRPKR